jgi:hypothetical protein
MAKTVAKVRLVVEAVDLPRRAGRTKSDTVLDSVEDPQPLPLISILFGIPRPLALARDRLEPSLSRQVQSHDVFRSDRRLRPATRQ